MIMNNRVIWDTNNGLLDPESAQTCFEKFVGEDVIQIKRRGLTISKIIKI